MTEKWTLFFRKTDEKAANGQQNRDIAHCRSNRETTREDEDENVWIFPKKRPEQAAPEPTTEAVRETDHDEANVRDAILTSNAS